MLLSHADRTRIVADAYRARLISDNGQIVGTVLVDGFVRGAWKIRRQRGTATLVIEPFERLAASDTAGLSTEGARLLAFAASDAPTHDIEFRATSPRAHS